MSCQKQIVGLLDLEVQVNDMTKDDAEFVRRYVLKVYGKKLPSFILDDLIQEGMIAYWNASQRFDEEKGVPLRGFAVSYISGRLKNYLRDKSRLIRTPRGDQYQHYTFQSEFVSTDEFGEEFVNTALTSEDDLTNTESYLSAYREVLTDQDIVIVAMLLDGASQRRIAEELNVSQMTVSRHVKKIREKVGQVVKETSSCCG